MPYAHGERPGSISDGGRGDRGAGGDRDGRVDRALPEGLVVTDSFDLRGDVRFGSGALVAQSRAAMLAARLLDPQPGERVLDLCAAPGGKTTHLAALMQGSGSVVAVERHQGRAEALRRTATRLHAAQVVSVETGEAEAPREDAPFDRALVDPPCSGLGTLQGRPDLRWRARPEAIGELAALQGRILAAAARALKPGGTLLYVTCTISRRENEDVVAAFLAAHPEYALEDLGAELPALASQVESRTLQLLPHRDGTDGFFLARLRRAPATAAARPATAETPAAPVPAPATAGTPVAPAPPRATAAMPVAPAPPPATAETHPAPAPAPASPTSAG